VIDFTHKDIDLLATKRLRTISNSSAQKGTSGLISLLDYARNYDLARENLAKLDKLKNIRGISPIRVKESELKCPTREEFEKLLILIKTFKNVAPYGVFRPIGKLDPRTIQATYLLQLIAYSGIRRNEAIRVRWKDLEFGGNRPSLRIHGGAQDIKNGLIRKIPLSHN